MADEDDPLADETWFNNRWRPAMAWVWLVTIVCDFILFPVLNAMAAGAGWIPYRPWQPITLQGGGVFHIGMAGVVGVAAWKRTDEKLAIMSGGYGGQTVMASSSTVEPAPAQKSSRAD